MNSKTTLTEKQLVLILAALSALTPLAIDMYLPALNSMEAIFNETNARLSISISVYFLGLAFGQLFGGPISDAYGRYPMIIVGLLIFCLTNLFIIFTTDIKMLWFARFVQAFGGGIAAVNIAATVRDMFSGKDSARIFSLIGSITILAPLLAPAFGLGIMSIFDNYRVIFVVLLLYSIGVLFFYKKYFKNIKKQNKSRITPIKNYINVLTNKKPMLMILALVISSSGLYCVITSSSFIYTNHFKLSSFWFVLCFSLNITMMLIAVKINLRFVKFRSPLKLLKFGMLSQLFLGIILLLINKTTNIYLFAPILALYVSTQGFIFGNAVSLILDKFPQISASANAVIGSLQYGVGSFSGFLSSHLNDETLFPIALILVSSSFIGVVILFISTGIKNEFSSN
ncbi:MAG: multidrug effflux MFS transporter [Campylobacteraceae bacterium]|jgi:DHA1 family bicyclomycin/chloramphenicol resistance-like MFS transporter|nr:multidrug effflux MFS transporter [Campylobacteraceae bacterium]